MNCQDARKHLHPYLDNELEVTENLAVVAHLGVCSPCQKLFGQEERGRERCLKALTQDTSPLSLMARIEDEVVGKASPMPSFRRWAARWSIPAAIAAAFALYVAIERPFADSPPKYIPQGLSSGINDASEVSHPAKPHSHGSAVVKFVGHYKSLHPEAAPGDKWLSRKVLDKNGLRQLTPSEARETMLKWVGAERRIPFEEELFGKGGFAGSAVGLTEDCPDGRKENQLLVDGGDSHRFGMFVLKQDSVDLKGFHIEADGITEGIKLERCRHCKVIAVTRGEEVLIFITEKVDTFDTLLTELKETL